WLVDSRCSERLVDGCTLLPSTPLSRSQRGPPGDRQPPPVGAGDPSRAELPRDHRDHRSRQRVAREPHADRERPPVVAPSDPGDRDRKSTRLNSSHVKISYAVFSLKKKN